MVYIVLIFILMSVLVVWKNEKVFSKVKLFFLKCKLLIVLELIIVIALIIFNILDSSVIIKEIQPCSNKVLRQVTLKEGEIYTYDTMYYEGNVEGNKVYNMVQSLKSKTNTIKIEEIGRTKVKVLVNNVEEEYKYGYGFSYYSLTSCTCGTEIIFEETSTTGDTGDIKIIILAIIIINLFILVFIKIKNTDKNKII